MMAQKNSIGKQLMAVSPNARTRGNEMKLAGARLKMKKK